MKNGISLSIILLQLIIIGMIYFCICRNNCSNSSDTNHKIIDSNQIANSQNMQNNLILEHFKKENPGILNGNETFELAKKIMNDTDSTNARNWINNYNATSNGLKSALTESAGVYLKSVSFSASNGSLKNLYDLFNDNLIDGLRIYIGKQTSDTSTKDYKLILVGMKNGVDTLILRNPTGTIFSSVQDYGNPCKPNCGGEKY